MFDALARVESELPALLRRDGWHSMHITYHPPEVERLWRQWGDLRINLHRIMPTAASTEVLFHPHPWPSIIKLLSGRYRMTVGHGPGVAAPPVAMRLELAPGSVYEMGEPDGWHAVAPLGEPSLSLMLTGKPWDRAMPAADHPPQGPLSAERAERLLSDFRALYGESGAAH
ncbi:hypothetical protein [Nannocystis punicea]|uniref:Cupin fold metalloprotein, WbuC family n=1 Tax=Nannocystis punicea TaxID=2995304 RepID=A0ABY7H7C0_9BACT|nr:hypothetical protein [Nannocystis poenicansa]WAS95173.1 hypothetical protein O0S08_03340 [Nannocystis poenicansa]